MKYHQPHQLHQQYFFASTLNVNDLNKYFHYQVKIRGHTFSISLVLVTM